MAYVGQSGVRVLMLANQVTGSSATERGLVSSVSAFPPVLVRILKSYPSADRGLRGGGECVADTRREGVSAAPPMASSLSLPPPPPPNSRSSSSSPAGLS